MTWFAVGISAVSVGLGLYGSQQAKKGAEKDAEYARRKGETNRIAANLEADVLEDQAGKTIASSQRDAIDIERRGKLVESRALALAAASGGGASSAPGFVHLYGTLAKETSYNKARAHYAGQEQARLKRLQARELREMGEFAVLGGNLSAEAAEGRGRAAELKGYSDAIATTGGMYAKYRGGGYG